MKEDVLDLLMYLFEYHLDEDDEDSSDHLQALRVHLDEAGFSAREVERALDWLERLVSDTPVSTCRTDSTAAQRIYTPAEQDRLNVEARGFLLLLEQNDLLTLGTRELIIDRVMELDTHEMDLERLRWIVLMVLFNQPDDPIAYARLQELVVHGHPAPGMTVRH